MSEETIGHQPTIIASPLSIISKAILQKNRFSQFLYAFLLFIYMVRFFYPTYLVLFESASLYLLNNNLVKFESLWIAFYTGYNCLILIYAFYSRSLYAQFMETAHEILDNNSFVANEHIIKSQSTILKMLACMCVYECTSDIIKSDLKTMLNDFAALNYSNIILHGIRFLATFAWVSTVHFIIESCMYLQSVFIVIDKYLEYYQTNLHIIGSNHNVLMSIRSVYMKVIIATRHIDKFNRYLIFGFYVYYTGYCLTLFGRFFFVANGSAAGNFIRFIGESAYVAVVTYYLVRINKLSISVYDRVYSFTLMKNKTIEFIHEVKFFLMRINQHDVGFTFGGLCIITTNFVSTILTIALTLGLGLPSLFP
uniref:Gustatory receptor n=1 Tax=Tetranychus urticae TaxID=32264 RepID=T1KDB4_TETUR